jgi:hypothetical protein
MEPTLGQFSGDDAGVGAGQELDERWWSEGPGDVGP